MAHVLTIDESNFDSLVLASEKPVLVDFTAKWCGPCKMIAPVLEALAEEHRDAFTVVAVDLDASPGLASRFSVRGAPTLVVFEGGHEVRRRLGAASKSTLLALVTNEGAVGRVAAHV